MLVFNFLQYAMLPHTMEDCIVTIDYCDATYFICRLLNVTVQTTVWSAVYVFSFKYITLQQLVYNH